MADGLQVFDNSFWNQGILRRLKLFLLERTFFQFSTFRKNFWLPVIYLFENRDRQHTAHSVNFHGSEFWAQCKSSVNMRFLNHFAIAEGNLDSSELRHFADFQFTVPFEIWDRLELLTLPEHCDDMKIDWY